MQSIIQGFTADYEVEAGNTSLILTKAQLNPHEIIKFQVDMINNNQIPGVINLNLRQKDLDHKFYYNVTGKVTLANYLRRQKVNKHQFLNLMDGILNTILDSKSYLLDNNSFLIDENYIYLDAKGLQVQLIYLPLPLKQNIIQAFKTFLSDLIISTVNLETTDNFLQSVLRLVKSEEINLLDLRNEFQKLKNPGKIENPEDPEISPAISYQERPGNFSPNNSDHLYQDITNKLYHDNNLYQDNTNNLYQDNDKLYNDNTNNIYQDYNTTYKNNSESIFSYEDDFSIKPPSNFNLKLNRRKLLLAVLAVISILTAILSTQEGGLEGSLQKANGLKYVLLGGGLIVFGLGIIFYILIKPKQLKQHEQAMSYNDSLTNLDNPTPKLANPMLFNTYAADSMTAASIAATSQPSSQTLATPLETNHTMGSIDEAINELTYQRDETVLLTDIKVPMLKAVHGREIIIINQPEFIIGRNGETCNYCLQEPSLGRAHVKIKKIDDSYYVTDLDSKNGTFLNGQRLISNKAYPLQNNDKLQLAKFEMLFQV